MEPFSLSLSLRDCHADLPPARLMDEIEDYDPLYDHRGYTYTSLAEAVSAIEVFLVARGMPAHSEELGEKQFDGRLSSQDRVNAQSYYPKNLLDALIELHNEYYYDVSTVDDWILRTFGNEYQLVRRRPFTALAELEKEDIKRRLMQDTMAPTVRRGRLLNCN